MKIVISLLFNLFLFKCIFSQSIQTNEVSVAFKTNFTDCTMFSSICKLSIFLRKSININELELESENQRIFKIKSINECPKYSKFDSDAFESADLSCLNFNSDTKDFNVFIIELEVRIIGKAFLEARVKEEKVVHQMIIKTAIRLVDRYTF